MTNQKLKQAIVAAVSQLVTVGTPFRSEEIERLLAGAETTPQSEAIRRLFFNRSNGQLSVDALLRAVAPTASASSTHSLTRNGDGTYLVQTI